MTATLVVAGVSSHVGKTTVVVALARALRRRGLRVVTCKCGPDYLDPTFHRLASGTEALSLDPYLMGTEGVRRAHAHAAEDADLVLVEGMMGLFDGPKVDSSDGSTAAIADAIGAPILLVVDASGMARTAAALVAGFDAFEPSTRIAATWFNRVGSSSHLALLRAACGDRAVFGLRKLAEHAFPSRHLGLRTAEGAVDESSIDAFADAVEREVDLDALLAIARTAKPPRAATPRVRRPRGARVRIGVADDEALHFLYPESIAQLEDAGADVVRFSPIRDALPDVHGVLLGGGYPELHAHAISDNRAFLEGIRRFASAGGPVVAECGGLMVLARAITLLDGERVPMAGVLDAEVRMREKLVALGYAEVVTKRASVLGPAGTRMRGHQFRYSEIEHLSDDVERLYALTRNRDGARSDEGFAVDSVVASYVHVHWASCPDVPLAFVDACARFARHATARRGAG